MIGRLIWLVGGIAGGAVATFFLLQPRTGSLLVSLPAAGEPPPAVGVVDMPTADATVDETEATLAAAAELTAPGADDGDLIEQINRMAMLATRDPAAALQLADALETQLARRLAYQRIGAAAVAGDPALALELGAQITDSELQSSFLASAFSSLAVTDPALAIEQLATIGGESLWEALLSQDVFAQLAAADPLALLDASERMPRNMDTSARSAALTVYARQQPEAALRRAENLPDDREQILAEVAAGYAQRDPATVMAWVEEHAPNSRRVAVSALTAIGETDPDQLLQIALRTSHYNGYSVMAALSVESFLERVPQIADALLTAGSQHQNSVTALLHSWAREDPERVMDWMAVNAHSLDNSIWRDVGRTVSQEGAASAAATIARLPQDSRNAWYEGIAVNLANQHPGSVTPAILGMPEGEGRDRAISSTLGSLLARGEPLDASLLEAFSSPAARDAAIRNNRFYMRSGNLHIAEQLEPLIEDPELRDEFRAFLDRLPR